MPDNKNIPPPPPGFEIVPPPPEGFTLNSNVPPPPPGFALDRAPDEAPTVTPAVDPALDVNPPTASASDVLKKILNNQLFTVAARNIPDWMRGGTLTLGGQARRALQAAKPSAQALNEEVKTLPPSSTGGKVAEFVGGIADPVALASSFGIGQLVKLPALAVARQNLANQASLALLGETTKDEIVKTAAKFASEYAKEAALRGAIEGGYFGLLGNLGHQADSGQPFAYGDALLNTGVGALTGGTLGYGMGRFLGARGETQKLTNNATKALEQYNADYAAAGEAAAAENLHKETIAKLQTAAAADAATLQVGRTPLSAEESALHSQKIAELSDSLAKLNEQRAALEPRSQSEILTEIIKQAYPGGSSDTAVPADLAERLRRLAMNQNYLEEATKRGTYLSDPALVELQQATEKEGFALQKELLKRAPKEAAPDFVAALRKQVDRKAPLFSEIDKRIGAIQEELAARTSELEQGRVLTPEELDAIHSRLQSTEDALAQRQRSGSPLENFLQRKTQPKGPQLSVDEINTHALAAHDELNNVVARLRAAGNNSAADLIEKNKSKYLANVVNDLIRPESRQVLPNGEVYVAPVYQQKAITSKFAGFLNQTTKFLKLDQKFEDSQAVPLLYELGAKEAQANNIYNRYASQATEALNGLRTLDQDFAERLGLYLQHVETGADGLPFWNASSEGKLLSMPEPGPEAKALLFKIRSLLDNAHLELGDGVPYKTAYVPHLNADVRVPLKTANIEKITDPSILFRQENALDPTRHVLQGERLLNYYFHTMADHVAYRDLVPKAQVEIYKMLARGYTTEAKDFARVMAESMHVKSRDEFVRLLQKDALGSLPEIVMDNIKDPIEASNFIKFMQRSMYDAKVFWNPKTQILNRLQPEIVGAPEIGLPWVERGRIGYSKNAGAAWLRDREMALTPDIRTAMIDGENGGAPTSGIWKALDKMSEWASTYPRKIFQGGEEKNRGAIFRGAYDQFTNAFNSGGRDALAPVIENMNVSQRRLVLRTLDSALAAGKPLEDALDAAASKYGLIRSLRTNFMMALADRPDLLRTGWGRLIPFTSWTRASFARLFENFSEGNARGVRLTAQQILPVLSTTVFLSKLTGTDVFSQVGQTIPAAAAINIFSGDALPSISQPLDQTLRKGPAAGAESLIGYTVPGKIFLDLRNAARASEDDGAAGALRSYLKTPASTATGEEQAARQISRFKRIFDFNKTAE